mmetsp:Transcript_20009/g.34177  ORF Transcript_20009/g.34177 Transcript_20009/m.34177 type:complete len:214 (+) Transcript_20009:314-955(+)
MDQFTGIVATYMHTQHTTGRFLKHQLENTVGRKNTTPQTLDIQGNGLTGINSHILGLLERKAVIGGFGGGPNGGGEGKGVGGQEGWIESFSGAADITIDAKLVVGVTGRNSDGVLVGCPEHGGNGGNALCRSRGGKKGTAQDISGRKDVPVLGRCLQSCIDDNSTVSIHINTGRSQIEIGRVGFPSHGGQIGIAFDFRNGIGRQGFTTTSLEF